MEEQRKTQKRKRIEFENNQLESAKKLLMFRPVSKTFNKERLDRLNNEKIINMAEYESKSYLKKSRKMQKMKEELKKRFHHSQIETLDIHQRGALTKNTNLTYKEAKSLNVSEAISIRKYNLTYEETKNPKFRMINNALGYIQPNGKEITFKELLTIEKDYQISALTILKMTLEEVLDKNFTEEKFNNLMGYMEKDQQEINEPKHIKNKQKM